MKLTVYTVDWIFGIFTGEIRQFTFIISFTRVLGESKILVKKQVSYPDHLASHSWELQKAYLQIRQNRQYCNIVNIRKKLQNNTEVQERDLYNNWGKRQKPEISTDIVFTNVVK